LASGADLYSSPAASESREVNEMEVVLG